jgi:hypothetical protein
MVALPPVTSLNIPDFPATDRIFSNSTFIRAIQIWRQISQKTMLHAAKK